jgi:hypothetical protein
MSVLRRIFTRNKDKPIKSPETETETETKPKSVEDLIDNEQFLEDLKNQGINVENKKDVRKYALIAFSVAGMGLLYTPNANAGWVDDLAKKAASQIKKVVEPMFNQIFDTFLGDILGFMGQGMDKTSSAIGIQTDTINTVSSDIANEQIKRATAPKPDNCRSDELGAESQKADQRTENRKKIYAIETNNQVFNTSPSKIREEMLRQSEKYSGSAKGENLVVSNISRSGGLNNQAQVDLARDITTNVIGPTASIVTTNIKRIMNSKGGTNVALELQSHMAAKGARIQIASSPMNDKIAANNNTTGKSRDAIFKEEIDRTYGDRNGIWRSEINAVSDPTPVVAELCKQTAFSNKLLLEQLKAIEQSNLIAGAQLLEQIESNQDNSISALI